MNRSQSVQYLAADQVQAIHGVESRSRADLIGSVRLRFGCGVNALLWTQPAKDMKRLGPLHDESLALQNLIGGVGVQKLELQLLPPFGRKPGAGTQNPVFSPFWHLCISAFVVGSKGKAQGPHFWGPPILTCTHLDGTLLLEPASQSCPSVSCKLRPKGRCHKRTTNPCKMGP